MRINKSIVLLLVCALLCVPHCMSGTAEAAENYDMETVMKDAPQLKYNETVVLEGTRYLGSERWMTYTEALQYHPTLPIPQTYKGYPIEACKVMLSTFNLFDMDIEPGQIVTLPDGPENIQSIEVYYSDEATSYLLQFTASYVKDGYTRQKIGEEGFLGFLLKTREEDRDIIHGIGIQKPNATLYLLDGDTSDYILGTEAGLSVHSRVYGTSKATEKNASTLLSDPELTGLFDTLVNFTQP